MSEPRHRLRVLHISDLHERGVLEKERWRRYRVLGDAWERNLAPPGPSYRSCLLHLRILVAGAAPFEELDALWNEHLINAREIRIGFLDREAAVGLLRKPIPEFPDEAVPAEIAEAVFERTGGQPNLVQLYGSLLVTRLNNQDRRQAEMGDVARVEEDVLTQETYYFRNILQESPPAARSALIDLAYDQSPTLEPATRRWLRRRLLLNEESRLTMPVFGAWIRAEEGK
jgi:hypothetical protein